MSSLTIYNSHTITIPGRPCQQIVVTLPCCRAGLTYHMLPIFANVAISMEVMTCKGAISMETVTSYPCMPPDHD